MDLDLTTCTSHALFIGADFEDSGEVGGSGEVEKGGEAGRAAAVVDEAAGRCGRRRGEREELLSSLDRGEAQGHGHRGRAPMGLAGPPRAWTGCREGNARGRWEAAWRSLVGGERWPGGG